MTQTTAPGLLVVAVAVFLTDNGGRDDDCCCSDSQGPCTACGPPDWQPYAAAALLAKATCRGTTLQLAMAGRLTGHGFKLSFILEKIATTLNFK